jgi:hypothetical protein
MIGYQDHNVYNYIFIIDWSTTRLEAKCAPFLFLSLQYGSALDLLHFNLDSLEWAHLFEQEHMSCCLGNLQWVYLVLVTNFGCNFELFALPDDCKLRSHPAMQPTRHALYWLSHTRVVVNWLSRVKKVASQLAYLIGTVSKPAGLCGWNSKRALPGFLNFISQIRIWNGDVQMVRKFCLRDFTCRLLFHSS